MGDASSHRRLLTSLALAAAPFVAGWAVAILTPVSDHDAPSLAITIAVSLLAGLIARSWCALLLPLLIVPLAVAQPCDASRFECDVNVWALALLIWAPASALVVAVGVALGKWLSAASRPPRAV